MSRVSVKSGLCDSKDYYVSFCALEKTECKSGTIFYSNRQISWGRSSCLREQFVREKSLGECADGTCSPNALSCGELSFNSVRNNGACFVNNTMFGRCGDRCLWSPDDCVNEAWTFPSELCSCDQVQVGACRKDELLFCAVSPDGCDDKSTWLSPSEIASTTDFRCHLCRENTFILPVSENTTKSSSEKFENSDEPYDLVPNPGSSSNYGPFIGGTIGGVVGATVVMTIFIYLRKRQTRREQLSKAPFTVVDASQNDDVSEL